MNIKERIQKINQYFKELQIVTIDGKQCIYVVVKFPNGWVIDDEIENKFDVTYQKSGFDGEFYFCTEMDNGEEKIFDAIEYNIAKMKEAIERAQLLNEKTIELKRLFENEDISIAQLRTLKITYDGFDLVITTKKNNKEDKKETETNE